MGFYCYEGKCQHEHEQNRRRYPSQQSLRQHRVRAHPHENPEETSVGRALKRKREVDTEELRKQQRLEEEEHIAALRVLEPEPPHQVRCQALFWWNIAFNTFVSNQDPLIRTGDRHRAHPVGKESTEPSSISRLHTDLNCSNSTWTVPNKEATDGGGKSQSRCCPA